MTRETSYRQEYCEELIEWMAKGKSYIAWGANHSPRFSYVTQYNWEKQFPEWKEAKKIGYALGLTYYENLLQACLVGVIPPELKKHGSKGVNITAAIFVLKTRFHKEYGEISKIDHRSSDMSFSHNMSKAEKLEMINKYKEKLIKDENEDSVSGE